MFRKLSAFAWEKKNVYILPILDAYQCTYLWIGQSNGRQKQIIGVNSWQTKHDSRSATYIEMDMDMDIDMDENPNVFFWC